MENSSGKIYGNVKVAVDALENAGFLVDRAYLETMRDLGEKQGDIFKITGHIVIRVVPNGTVPEVW
jgi:hypothetical protein